ncbi:MAG: hypothetical protein ABJO02_20110 [Reichenbachiella sp.]|uniref:hypothetical protein n=1 Tax=Reichenbachiella sp. TaxID=2184521 RepID=UPI003296C196
MDLQSTLNNCKSRIEEKLNWGPHDQWQNQEFEELSQIIFNKTGVNLSHTTLKRVWGKVKYDNQPSISTLDTLAKFLDYSSWSAFKRAQETNRSSKKPQWTFQRSKKPVSIIAMIILLSFSSWFIITNNLDDPSELSANLNFEASYTSKGLPNTVVFSFDASKIEADQLVIQQNWNQRRRIEVDRNQATATSVYYYPGYFRSKFVADEVVLKESDVYIQTEGWMGTINTEPVPIYLNSNDLARTEKLALSPSGAVKRDKANKPVSFHYYTAQKNISGNDFDFETRIRYANDNQSSACKYAKVVLLFSEGAFLVPLVIPGCVGEISLMAMDNFVSGKENDLSVLGISLSEWQQINISSHNKVLTISIGHQLLSVPFKMEPGYLVGISYQFDGSGEVDYLALANTEASWQFDDNF